MSAVIDLDYTLEKLDAAVSALRDEKRPLALAVGDAFMAVLVLDEADFPLDLRQRWTVIFAKGTSKLAVGDLSAFDVSAQAMDATELRAVADEFMALHADLGRLRQPR